jgi:hypothetical protein
VPDPDALLSVLGDAVVTADSAILDRRGPWVNLARAFVEVAVSNAFIADLGSGPRRWRRLRAVGC